MVQARWSRGRLVFRGDALDENLCIRVGFTAIGVRMEAPFRSPVLPDWLLARRRWHKGRSLYKPQGRLRWSSCKFDAATRRTGLAGVTRRGRVLPTKSAATSLCAFVDGAPSILTFRDYDWGREHRGIPGNALAARLQRGPDPNGRLRNSTFGFCGLLRDL